MLKPVKMFKIAVNANHTSTVVHIYNTRPWSIFICLLSFYHCYYFVVYYPDTYFLQKSIRAQLTHVFPAFHATRIFITVFKRVIHWILFRELWTHSIPSHILYVRCIAVWWCLLSMSLQLFYLDFQDSLIMSGKWTNSDVSSWWTSKCRKSSTNIYFGVKFLF
jgi:hypothetical protein